MKFLPPRPACAFTTTVGKSLAVRGNTSGQVHGEQAGKRVRLPGLLKGTSCFFRCQKIASGFWAGNATTGKTEGRCSRGNDCLRPCCEMGFGKFVEIRHRAERAGNAAPLPPARAAGFHARYRESPAACRMPPGQNGGRPKGTVPIFVSTRMASPLDAGTHRVNPRALFRNAAFATIQIVARILFTRALP